MAKKTMDEYTKEIMDKNKPTLDAQNKTVTDTATKNIDTINTNYDAAEKKVVDNYNLGVDEVNQDAADQRRAQQVQRIVNERVVTERMANLGLTDSGLNRSQQTGIQLSYANNVSKINQNQQKAIDTLAATMRASMSDLSLERASKITEVETNRDNAIAQNNTAFNQWAQAQATSLYNQDTAAEAEREKQKSADYNTVISTITDPTKTSAQMMLAINSYVSTYGLSDDEKKGLTDTANTTLTTAYQEQFNKDAETLGDYISNPNYTTTQKYNEISQFKTKYGLTDADVKPYVDVVVDQGNADFAKKADAEFAKLITFLSDPDNSKSEMEGAISSYESLYGLNDNQRAYLVDTANGTLTDKQVADNNKAAADFATEAKKEISSLETFIFSSSNSDKAKYAKIQSAYNKGYISSEQKASYDSLVSEVSTEGAPKKMSFTDVIKMIDDDTSESDALAMIYDYAVSNDVDVDQSTFLNNNISDLLAEAGISASTWRNYFARRKGVSVPEVSNADANAGDILPFDLSGSNLRDWLEYEKNLGKDSQWQIPMKSTVGLPTVKTTLSSTQSSNSTQNSKGSGFKVADTYENVQAQNAAKGLTWLGNLLKGWL